MKMRRYQIAMPEKKLDHKAGDRLLAQAAGISASYEQQVFSAIDPLQIDQIRLVADTAIPAPTVGSIAATGFVNLWRPVSGVYQQLSNDGVLGVYTFNAVANTLAKFTPLDLAPVAPTAAAYGLNGYAFVGYLSAAVTGGSSTGGTIVALGTNLLTTLEATAVLNAGSFSLIVEPGTANEEIVQVGTYTVGTGVFVIAASGKFVNSHAAGVLCCTTGGYIWQGTQAGAMTAGTTTGGTLTAIAPSVLTGIIGVGSQLVLEPNTTNQEIVPIGAYTSGTGVYTIAAGYNGGKCLSAHAAGASVAVLAGGGPIREVLAGDVVTFKWAQSPTTGLALPASRLEVSFSPSGYRY